VSKCHSVEVVTAKASGGGRLPECRRRSDERPGDDQDGAGIPLARRHGYRGFADDASPGTFARNERRNIVDEGFARE
jgi:hypothetical protein